MDVPLTTTVKKEKKKLLVWSDSVLATTGFGRVAEHILGALHATGRYEIDQLAINHNVTFYDMEKYPYCITPAKMRDPRDLYGKQAFLDAIHIKDYDLIFIINDTYVVKDIANRIRPIRDEFLNRGRKPFKLIYYYPIDCRLPRNCAGMIQAADKSVAYTNFAAEETKKAIGHYPTNVIYHGTDVNNFFPLQSEERRMHRARFFNADDNTFIITNVNRNSMRKDIARTIYTFAEFRKKHPNTILYLHMLPQDAGGGGYMVDLLSPIEELGLEMNKDVFFPQKYSASNGFPTYILNQLYNCADVYLSTHLGEGFGLTQCEAMAAGVPVIVPDNTVTPEVVGENRGYVYPCNGITFVDASGYRKQGRVEDILAKLEEAYTDWKENSPSRISKIENAQAFVQNYSWANVNQQWIRLFRETEKIKITQSSSNGEKL